MIHHCTLSFAFSSSSSSLINPSRQSFSFLPNKTQVISKLDRNNESGRRIWRRRKLTKNDDMLRYSTDRIPFLEEQVRKIRESGKTLTADIHTLLLREDNRFNFVNEVAAEASEYVEANRDEYGGKKKAILHVLSNRMNDAGYDRPVAYEETDPYKPGPGWMVEYYT